MPVSYTSNGNTGTPATMILDPVQQLGYEQIPIWDGPTYLYTIHRFHFRGTYNPATFSWNLNAGPGAVPFQVPGMLPPSSNNATRHFLSQPRGTFVYNIGGVVVGGAVVGGIESLRCPTNVPGSNVNPDGTTIGSVSPRFDIQYQTDCDNGPTPLHCHVVEVKGIKTFVVDWAIECAVNECYLFKTSQSLSALLSQRWTYEEDLDQDFFATRTIKGHAIFRTDRLLALSAVPDDYREWLFHPVPDNFQRTVQQCVLNADGTRLDYVLVDREKPFNLTNSVVNVGVTRIEAFSTRGYSRNIGSEEAVFRFMANGVEATLLAATSSFNDPLIGVRHAIQLIPRQIDLSVNAVPRFHQQVTCRVWGNRTATRKNLWQTAINVFSAKIGNEPLKIGSGNVDVTEDLMGKFVELTAHVVTGPIRGYQVAGGVGLAVPNVGPDLLPGVTQNNPSIQPQPSLGFAREDKYRAMAQVLAGNCGLTPQPTNAEPYNSLSP